MNVTVKAEVRTVPPPPPKQELVITMELHDAILLRVDLHKAIAASEFQHFGLNRLVNVLDQLSLET